MGVKPPDSCGAEFSVTWAVTESCTHTVFVNTAAQNTGAHLFLLKQGTTI